MVHPDIDLFAEKTTSHIRRLAGSSAAIRKMYYFDPEYERLPVNRDVDLFLEKQLTQTKGLVYKYSGRVIVLLSYTCAANCRYCERQDRVGVGLDEQGRLSNIEIERAADFVARSEEISEVIFSGGDPLTHPRGLEHAAQLIAQIPHVNIIRVHTRYPIQVPDKTDFELVERLAALRTTLYISLHIDHPDELTTHTESAIQRLRMAGAILLCQSVFLKGVNDDCDVLSRLFTRLVELGVRPYYIYHCHPIPTTMRFVMRLEQEIKIMSRLRERLSGIACPQHIFEMRHTTGKLVVPTDHWNVDLMEVRDFNQKAMDINKLAHEI